MAKNVCKLMFLRTLALKSDGMITKMVRAQRENYEETIARIEYRRVNYPPSNRSQSHANKFEKSGHRQVGTQEFTIQAIS